MWHGMVRVLSIERRGGLKGGGVIIFLPVFVRSGSGIFCSCHCSLQILFGKKERCGCEAKSNNLLGHHGPCSSMTKGGERCGVLMMMDVCKGEIMFYL